MNSLMEGGMDRTDTSVRTDTCINRHLEIIRCVFHCKVLMFQFAADVEGGAEWKLHCL